MESSWSERHIRRLLRRRPPTWMVWGWLLPAVVFLILSALSFDDGIQAAAAAGIPGFFCVFIARYTFEIQRFYDLVTRLESENAELRGRLGGS